MYVHIRIIGLYGTAYYAFMLPTYYAMLHDHKLHSILCSCVMLVLIRTYIRKITRSLWLKVLSTEVFIGFAVLKLLCQTLFKPSVTVALSF